MDAHDLARIRFVTSRYHELQGLRQLVILPACLMRSGRGPICGIAARHGSVGSRGGVRPLSRAVAASSPRPTTCSTATTAQRFGSVATGPSCRSATWSVRGGAARRWLWPSICRVLASGQAAARCSSALALIALHIVVRDWPWRAYHLGYRDRLRRRRSRCTAAAAPGVDRPGRRAADVRSPS